MNRHERRRANKLKRRHTSKTMAKDLGRIFGGEDNMALTDELINELIEKKGMKEEDVRQFAKMGALYCPPRNSS
jgi:hypothetical protein